MLSGATKAIVTPRPCSSDPASPGSAVGLGRSGKSSRPVPSSSDAVIATATPEPAHSTGRHRADSGRPLGKSSSPTVGTTPSAGTHCHPSSQPAQLPPGSLEPGANAACAYA